jgi:hypothetical protein
LVISNEPLDIDFSTNSRLGVVSQASVQVTIVMDGSRSLLWFFAAFIKFNASEVVLISYQRLHILN